MNNMSKFESCSRSLTWLLALLLVALAAGCGSGGDGGRDPILGTPGGVAGPVAPAAPTVTAVAPLADATGVPISTKVITAAFSKAMNPATLTTASFTLACPAGTPVTGAVTYLAAGSVATLTLPAAPNLPPSTICTATVTTGASDSTGLPLASNFVWTFTTGVTPDTTRPSVSLTVPANAAINVVTNTTAITAVFTEDMAPATITAAGTFTVTGPGVTPVAGAVTYVVGSRTAVFTPAAVLTAGTTYTATITTAATDLAGNPLLSPVLLPVLPQVPNPWTFTTVPALDTTPPLVNSTNPANGAANAGVGQNISATFNETMNAQSVVNAFTLTGPGATPVAGLVTYNAATSIATFNPINNLTPGVTYTARISTAATDLAGNALVVPAVSGLPVPNPWTFSIPAVPPVVPPVVALGAAAPFGAFGGAAGITNQGLLTVINGDIGTTGASTLVTGFHDAGPGCIYTETPLNVGTVNGTIFTAAPPPTPVCSAEGTAATFAIATQGLAAAQTAFNTLAALPNGIDVGISGPAGPGELGGRTLAPGVYRSAPGSYGITVGNLTLDAQGDPNASWVFQMGTSLTVGIAGPAGARSVILTNGAQAKNVFWQVGSSATINAAGGGIMVGTIISSAATTFSTAGNVAIVTLNGRAMALAASVTMVNTVINVPAP